MRNTLAPSAKVDRSGNSSLAHHSAGIGCVSSSTSNAGPHHHAGAGARGVDDELLAVNDALDKLAATHAIQAEVVKLRWFAGMTNAETAQALNLSERTVKYYWAHARAWLIHEITSQRQ